MGWYSAIGRRAFFALPPDAAHRLVEALLGLPLPWERIGHADPDPRLAVELAGIPLRNPFGLAAGFDKRCAHLDALGRLGFGYLVGGTTTRLPRRGNAKPRIIRYPAKRAIANSMGLPNPGIEAVARALRSKPPTAPRIVSLADEATKDVVASVRVVEPLVDGFELNASSPNAGWRHEESHVSEILQAVRDRTGKPIFVKLPPFRSNQERDIVLAMAATCRGLGAAGLTCSNTVRVQERRLGSGSGGLSGRPLAPLTPAIVREVRIATGGAMPINACGGVFTAADALACLEAGATTVQVYTALLYEGPALIGELTSGLSAILRERGSDVRALVARR